MISLPTIRRRLRARPEATVVLTDFDGTLADIVADPAAARPAAGAVEAATAIAGRYLRFGVVSGRTVTFLESFFADPAVDLSGVYGLESRIDGQRRDHPAAEEWRRRIGAVARAAEEQGFPDGVIVEPKGLSLTLHYRLAPDAEDGLRSWAAATAAEAGLSVRDARRSVELHPPVAVDKGDAVAALASGAVAIVYIGDDIGDLPAWHALDELAAGGDVEAIRIAVRSEELPDELASRADLVLQSPAAVVDLLTSLA